MNNYKKIFFTGIIVLFTIGLIFSAVSCISFSTNDIDPSAKKVIEGWALGLEKMDIETLMASYWPEAVFDFIPPEGEKIVLTGSEQIRTGQEDGFIDRPEIDILLDLVTVVKNGQRIIYTISVLFPGVELINILELVERNNNWKIIKQVVSIKI